MELLASLARDLRFAVRQMRHTPIVSIVALLSLALGIGANVAIFSLVNALILKALPVYQPERLVLLGFASDRGGRPDTSFTNPQTTLAAAAAIAGYLPARRAAPIDRTVALRED